MEQLIPPLETETRFGKFIFRRKLGEGGMAEVFLAELGGPSGFNRLVAVKCLLPVFETNADSKDSFISEARIGGSLNHPNIVQTLELGCEEDRYFLTMEFVDGLTLGQLLKYCSRSRTPLPLPVVLDITLQICEGLAYAHQATDARGTPLHMIHRDLKPGNILISLYGTVKITDFGVAKATSNLKQTTAMGMLKGTIGYMSPEQASCEELDSRADLFSLGAILFAMLTLEPLYLHTAGLAGLRQVILAENEERLALLEPLPPAWGDLVRKLLARDREERYSSAAEVKRELMAIADTLAGSRVDLGAFIRDMVARSNAMQDPSPDVTLDTLDPEGLSLDASVLQPQPGGDSSASVHLRPEQLAMLPLQMLNGAPLSEQRGTPPGGHAPDPASELVEELPTEVLQRPMRRSKPSLSTEQVTVPLLRPSSPAQPAAAGTENAAGPTGPGLPRPAREAEGGPDSPARSLGPDHEVRRQTGEKSATASASHGHPEPGQRSPGSPGRLMRITGGMGTPAIVAAIVAVIAVVIAVVMMALRS